jgi:hypothetical protein
MITPSESPSGKMPCPTANAISNHNQQIEGKVDAIEFENMRPMKRGW